MKKLAFFIFVLAGVSFSSCEKDTPTPAPIIPVDSSKLTTQELSDLRFLREEEKLARDVYIYCFQKYGQQVFEKISGSEQAHMDQVLDILTFYGYEDPAVSDTGVFQDVDLQNLYNVLTTKSDSSLVDALEVGATIEDLDIHDIVSFVDNTNKTDILAMYEMLECGSKNHIQSFSKQLTNNGVTYVPQFISVEYYNEIMDGGHLSCQ